MHNAIATESPTALPAVTNANYIFVVGTLRSRLYHAEIAYTTALDAACALRTEASYKVKEAASAALIQVRKDLAAVERLTGRA